MLNLPETIHLNNQKQYRIIPSVYPPINFFEDLADPSEMEILWEIEALTNERLRQEVGDIFLVHEDDRICGPGSSIVMAAFTHIINPTRFSDGSYGIYYAGLSKETAIHETVYHRERFLEATNEDPCELSMRLYEGVIKQPLHDIRNESFVDLHNPYSYERSQEFGQTLKTLNSWGLVYNSVRHHDGQCIAILRAPAVSIPKQSAHLKYIWNGRRITEVLNTTSVLVF